MSTFIVTCDGISGKVITMDNYPSREEIEQALAPAMGQLMYVIAKEMTKMLENIGDPRLRSLSDEITLEKYHESAPVVKEAVKDAIKKKGAEVYKVDTSVEKKVYQ